MPHILYGDITKGNFQAILSSSDHYDYDYPEGLNLDPKSELHRKIVTEVIRRAQASNRVMSNRFGSWNEIDRILTTYIEPDSSLNLREGEEKDIKKDKSKKPVSIIFPYSYAILETILTYLVMAFLEDPIFRYEGQSPDDVMGAILLEKIIDLHTNKTKVGLALHTMFRDSLAYGLGIGAPSWMKHMGSKMVRQESGILDFLGQMMGVGPKKMIAEDQVLFEGNKLSTIDPYLWLPDPNVPCDKVQEGEFCGWIDRTSFVKLLNEEAIGPDLFNVRYLRALTGKKSSLYGEDKSARFEKTNTHTREAGGRLDATSPTDVINMYIDLIPKDWNDGKDIALGKSEYPEKWLFSVAADSVVIKAKRLGLTHNMYPVAIVAPDSDGYQSTPVSRIEILYGLQECMDWLFNSHIANVRKALNDMIVYDPYLINSSDVENPGPGKLIRTRRPAWGRGVENAIQQLKVGDVTAQNIGDVSWIMQMMQKAGGADNPIMGSLRQGGPERLTKAEFQGTTTGAVNRLERLAKIIGLQGMQDIGYMFAAHTQQMMSEETYIKTIGRWQEELTKEFGDSIKRGRMKVSPMDLLVDYDVFVRDGSVPGSNFSESWIRMWELMGKYPALASKFDLVRIFRYIARNLGAKNISDFEIGRAQIVPDEEVMRQAEAGNIVPAGGGLARS